MSSSENIAWQVVNDITVYNNNYFNREGASVMLAV